MPTTFLDMFPPEVQTACGIAAALSAVAGLFLWGAGIKIARFSSAVLMGVTTCVVAVWGLPGPTGIAPLTAALIGFVVGILVGAVAFRFLQGILVAACLALLVCGGYYRVQVQHTQPLIATTAPATPTTLTAQELQIPLDKLSPPPASNDVVATLQNAGNQAMHTVSERWVAIAPIHRQHMTLLAILTAVVGLLVAIFFPKYTTWILSAALGTGVLLAAGYALMQVYLPQYQLVMPSAPVARWGVVAILMLVGLLIQRVCFWPRKRRPKEASTAVAA